MRSRVGAARSRRVALIALIVLLVPLAVDVVSDDVWVAALELDADPGRGHSGEEAVDARVDLIAPRPSQRLRLFVADDPALVGWIAVTPTDRAPPRA